MDSISSLVNLITPSLTLSITNQAKALKAQGEEIYGLAGGEPDCDTPGFIKQAAITALNEGKTKYTPAAGIPELREAIAKKLSDQNNISYEPSQIIVNSGAKHSCLNAILATIEEGDEVIIPAPFWVSYPEMVRLAGGVPVIVETSKENDWKISPQQFEENMTGLTKMIILNTPNNPTGTVYSKDELKALGEVALLEDIIILSDEIYEDLTYDNVQHTSIASLSKELYDITITIGGFSKAYSMTGWRVGYTAAPATLAEAMIKIQGHTTSNACSFAQYGALAALQHKSSFIEDLKAEYNVRRKFVQSQLNSISNVSFVEPKGAFYFFVDCSELGMKSVNLCDKLLNRHKVAAVPGVAFGCDYGIRLSYCTTLDILHEGVSRFAEFCQSH